jgi:NTE family protein
MQRTHVRARATLIVLALAIAIAPAESAPRAQERKRPTVAVVLAGGGARGFAHVGVLKVIEELGIPVDIVTGTSMGAIVGGLYSVGYTPGDMDAIMSETDWPDIFSEEMENISEPYPDKRDRSRYFVKTAFDRKGLVFSGGLLSGKKVLHELDALFLPVAEPTDFDALPRRFRAVSVDIASGDRVVHEKGSLPDSIRASMSIPGVFVPYQLNGQAHVDGFVADNLPIDLAREIGADYVIAVDIRDAKGLDPEAYDQNITKILARTVALMERSGVNHQLKNADLVLTIDPSGYTTVDFTKAREIMDLGERTARERIAELATFRDRVLASGAERREIPRPATPVIETIEIEGGTAKDRASVRQVFEPIIGTAPSRKTIGDAFFRLDRDIRFESVKVRLERKMGAPTLVVSVRDRPLRSTFLRMGFDYHSTYSEYFINGISVTPGAIVRGIPLKDSRLAVDAEPVDSPGLDAEFSQPFSDYFSVSLHGSVHADLDTWVAKAARPYMERTRSSTVGVRLSLYNWSGGEATIGCGVDYGDDELLEGIVAGEPAKSAFCLRGSFSADTRNSPILTRYGFFSVTRALYALPFDDTRRAFATAEILGGVFIPVGNAFSLAVRWEGGTDFTPTGDAFNAAPARYKPALRSRILFPGLLSLGERIGSHALGAGISAQYALNSNAATKSVPVCAIAEISSGASVVNGNDLEAAKDRVHVTGAVGFGMRFNDAFGIMIRGGACRNTEADLLPFFAIDIGSFGK